MFPSKIFLLNYFSPPVLRFRPHLFVFLQSKKALSPNFIFPNFPSIQSFCLRFVSCMACLQNTIKFVRHKNPFPLKFLIVNIPLEKTSIASTYRSKNYITQYYSSSKHWMKSSKPLLWLEGADQIETKTLEIIQVLCGYNLMFILNCFPYILIQRM
jgi:hypothetical protein